MFQTKARPRFVTGGVFDGLNDWDKLRTCDAAAAAHDFLLRRVQNMYHAKMDIADVGAVVVDDCDRGLLHLLDGNFLE